MTMLEKAARALDARLAIEWFTSSEDAVLTVLAAIREPDERMLRAFDRMTDEHGQCLVKTGYRAMIDTILEGESK